LLLAKLASSEANPSSEAIASLAMKRETSRG